MSFFCSVLRGLKAINACLIDSSEKVTKRFAVHSCFRIASCGFICGSSGHGNSHIFYDDFVRRNLPIYM